MIEMENITKVYGEARNPVKVIKGISLFVDKGEFVSIMGPSGSGKSTLAAILGCLSAPSSGIYKINGIDVTQISKKSMASLRNQNIGYIFQDFHLLDGQTAWENVSLPLVYAGISAGKRKARALECLAAVGLSDRVSHYPNQLSGGQKQRVAIARALVNNPVFLFADEATGALDKKTGQEVLSIMQKLNLEGHTIIQVTHSREDAQYSKRILHLVDGLIVKDEMVDRPMIGNISLNEQEDDQLVGRIWRVAQVAPIKNPEDFASLKKLFLKTSSRSSIVHAIKAIAPWTDSACEEILRKLMHHTDWVIRSEVVRNARKRQTGFVLEICRLGLEDDNAWVRQLSLLELKECGVKNLQESDIELVFKHFEDSDERIRATVVKIIPEFKDSRAMEFLARALKDRDGRVRANALDAMQEMGAYENYLHVIKPMLNDSHNRARGNAALMMFDFFPAEATHTLSEMINSDSNMLRGSAAWSLGMIETVAAGKMLLQALQVEKQDLVLGQIVKSLGKIAEKELSVSKQIEIVAP